MRSGDLSDLARQAGYSPRHLRRRLLAAAGLGPKRLQRIGRMQRALSAGRGESWARTAVEHGWRAFGLEAEDVPAALARAVAAGAEPEQEAVVKPWGQTVAYVRDPNGTLIEPGSPVAG